MVSKMLQPLQSQRKIFGIYERGSQVELGVSFDEVTNRGNPAPVRNKILAVPIQLSRLTLAKLIKPNVVHVLN